nr:zinc finger, CCHC-type [Tanacetum cinerariifolium]
MSKVKCYNCKKEGYFAKDCKKSNVKDYEYYKTKMLLTKKDKDEQVLLAEDHAWMEFSNDLDQEINENMVFMPQIEKVLSDSEASSSSSDDKIAKMTTSSTNNSIFRGFFKKQKLTGPNFIDWYQQVRIVLSIKDKLNYLEQPIPPAPVAPAGQQVAPEILAAHNAWIKGPKEIAGLMLMTMEPKIQQNLGPLHAHEMLRELKTLFAQQAENELLQTTRDFHSCRQKEGHMGKTINELHAMLKLHEQTLLKNNAPALNAIRAGKVQKGHWKRNCPQYFAELLKKKKNAASGAGGS